MSFESAITCTVLYAQHPEQAPWLYSGPMSMCARQSKSEGRSMSSGRTVVVPPSDAEDAEDVVEKASSSKKDAAAFSASALRSRANIAAASAARSSSSDKSASSAASAPSVATSFSFSPGASSPRLARPVLQPSAASVAAKNPSADDFGRFSAPSSPFAFFPSSARRGASAPPALSPVSFSSRLGATLTPATYVAWFAANSSGVRSAKRVTIFFIPPAPFSARAALCCSMCRMLRSRMISRR